MLYLISKESNIVDISRTLELPGNFTSGVHVKLYFNAMGAQKNVQRRQVATKRKAYAVKKSINKNNKQVSYGSISL